MNQMQTSRGAFFGSAATMAIIVSRLDVAIAAGTLGGAGGFWTTSDGSGGGCDEEDGCGLEKLTGIKWYDGEDEVGGNRVMAAAQQEMNFPSAFCVMFYKGYDAWLEQGKDVNAYTHNILHAIVPGMNLDTVVALKQERPDMSLLSAIRKVAERHVAAQRKTWMPTFLRAANGNARRLQAA